MNLLSLGRKGAAFAVLPLAVAAAQAAAQNTSAPQESVPPPPAPVMNDKRRAALAAYDPVIRLIAYVTSLDKVSKANKVTFTSLEKTALASFLNELSRRQDLKPAQATKEMTRLQKLLSADQRNAVETVWRERDDARRKAGAPQEMTLPDGRTVRFDRAAPPRDLPAPPDSSEMLPAPPPADGSAPSRLSPPSGGLNQAITEGKPYNPFSPQDFIAGRAVQNLVKRFAPDRGAPTG